jgi:hypothetical protein
MMLAVLYNASIQFHVIMYQFTAHTGRAVARTLSAISRAWGCIFRWWIAGQAGWQIKLIAGLYGRREYGTTAYCI